MRQGCGQGRMANCQRGIFDKLHPSRSPGATAAVAANAQTVPHSVAPLHSLPRKAHGDH